MGEIVNFPKAKRLIPGGAEDPRLLTHVSALSSDLRALDNTRQSDGSINTCVNKRPSWGVFDNHDGDTPDAA